MFTLFQNLDFSLSRTTVVLVAVAALASFDLSQRIQHKKTQYLLACVFGSILAFGLINVVLLIGKPGIGQNPHVLALGVLLLILGWNVLFSAWGARTKVVVLGTFLFWVAFSMGLRESASELNTQFIAGAIALIPAAVWCMLFLRYHTENVSTVILMFFAGILSTAPILVYDVFVRKGVELQFFLFRITPESFNATSEHFVSAMIPDASNATRLLFTALVSFLIVGLIEEVSKFWVTYKSGQRLFSSIDDVIELSIITAIGFAFAENVVNPLYFRSFVEQYLLGPSIDLTSFISNIVGRSVLTSMVHILSTGVMGYFIGLGIFAEPYLKDREDQQKKSFILEILHRVTRVPKARIFRHLMIWTGVLTAIVLHGSFNFMVSLPDLLPGRPRSVGDALGSDLLILRMIPLLLIPALIYVVGGFWFLTGLFLSQQNRKERGTPIWRHVFVKEA